MVTESTMLFGRIKRLIVHHSPRDASMRLWPSRLIIFESVSFRVRHEIEKHEKPKNFFFVSPCFPDGFELSNSQGRIVWLYVLTKIVKSENEVM